jgi:asparagine synthase (glutamine-hydrolysing)
MSGIAGFLGHEPRAQCVARVSRMMQAEGHRGPDDTAEWAGRVGDVGIALGEVRLSAGRPVPGRRGPTASPDGRRVLLLDGEVHNVGDLKTRLSSLASGLPLDSDAEVILASLVSWGRDALPLLNGSWAVALLDADAQTLLLARDHLGTKPLYIYPGRGGLFFGSEIKAILAGCGERFRVDAAVAGAYLARGQLDAAEPTFFSGISALRAAHVLSLDLSRLLPVPASTRYWAIPGEGTPFRTETEPIEQLRETLVDAVRVRASAGVPLGVLLSGGVDSSCVAAALRAVLGPGEGLPAVSGVAEDERLRDPLLGRMIAHLGCEPKSVPVTIAPARAVPLLETATWFNDEPLSSFAEVAAYLIMLGAKAAGVSVLLSGLGADEVLCGRPAHVTLYLESLARSGRWFEALRATTDVWRSRAVRPGRLIRIPRRFVPRFLRSSVPDVRGPVLRTGPAMPEPGLATLTFQERQVADIVRLTLPGVLHRADRMAVAAGRLIRLPFLDYRLVSLAVPMAPEWKIREGFPKWVLRKAMEPYVPREVAWRTATQPRHDAYGAWLRTVLRDEAAGFLSEGWLTSAAGLVDERALHRLLGTFIRQGREARAISANAVFRPLALETWARRFRTSLDLS